MNTIVKYVVWLGLLLGVTTVSAQQKVATFRSFRETKGLVTTASKGVYVWGAWEQSSSIISIDMKGKKVHVIDQINNNKETTYDIYELPQKWTVKKDHKFINMECMKTDTMDKFYIRLYEYDSGEYRVTIMSPSAAVRYSVVYSKENDDESVNFDDV